MTITYQVWTGFDEDEMELTREFDNKADALASADNCCEFADLVEVREVSFDA